MEVSLSNGRRQEVFIETSEDRVADRLVSIRSLCAPAQASEFERVLRLNCNLRHSAVSLQDIVGQPYFVMSNAYPRSTVDPEEIRRSVREIAESADEIESRITGRDQH